MCVVQVVPFARSVPGGSRNDGRGVGERMGSRYMSQQTSMNKTSCAEHSQKYGRVATRTKGQEKKMTYWKKKKRTFLQVDCFHTRHSNPFFWCQMHYTKSRGGAVWQFVSARKVRAPVLCCTVLYKYMRLRLGCSMRRLLLLQCPQRTWNLTLPGSNMSKMFYFWTAGLWLQCIFVH